MLNRFKFLPALALAAALSPLAANAWTGQVSNQGNAHEQVLVSAPGSAQQSSNSQGRPGEFNANPGQTQTDSTPQYAQSGQAVAGEGG